MLEKLDWSLRIHLHFLSLPDIPFCKSRARDETSTQSVGECEDLAAHRHIYVYIYMYLFLDFGPKVY
jgi:hypothetical protein